MDIERENRLLVKINEQLVRVIQKREEIIERQNQIIDTQNQKIEKILSLLERSTADTEQANQNCFMLDTQLRMLTDEQEFKGNC